MKAALSHCSETKTITFPMWRDERKFLFSVNDILGAFAMWAVRQSPYRCPDSLNEAIDILEMVLINQIEFDNEPLAFKELSCDEIRKHLETAFEKVSAIMNWNEKKSGAPGYVFVSRVGGPKNPDDDIIDLGAMARNIAHTLILERLYDED